MKTETREERIKRLLEARESDTLDEVASASKVTQTPDVTKEEAEDWEEESRLISSKNQKRIKEASQKSAELASQGAKAASKIAGQGLVRGVAMLKAIKDKVQEKKAEKASETSPRSNKAYERFRRREEKRFADRVAAEASDTDFPYQAPSRIMARLEEIVEEQQERSVDESSALEERVEDTSKVTRPHWLTPKLAVIVVGLVIVGIGAAWFARYGRSADSITQTHVEATTAPTPDVVQVMPQVEAVLPPLAPAPPTEELPPLPEAVTPVAIEPPVTRAVSIPVASKPRKAVQVVSVQKVQPKPAPVPVQQESEWQKDASKKLDDWEL